MNIKSFFFVAAFFTAPVFSDVPTKPPQAQEIFQSPNGNDFKFWEANEPTLYVGASGQVSDSISAHSVDAISIETASVNEVDKMKFHSTSSAWGFQAFAGMNINKLLAVEIKYLQMLEPFRFTKTFDYSPDSLFLSNSAKYKVTQLAFGPMVLVSIPISRYFTPYFKGGFYAYRHHLTKKYVPGTAGLPTPLSLKSGYWNLRMVEGFGIRSDILDFFGIRLEYECPTNPLITTTGKFLFGNLNLSGYLRF